MSDFWDSSWIGIERLIMADAYILAIQFDLSIDGRSWNQLTTVEKIAKFREKLNLLTSGLDQAIEDSVRNYEQYENEKRNKVEKK